MIGLSFRDNQPSTISSTGNLAVEQDLTLAGGNLDLQGQLQAEEDLSLQATDTVKLRDSAANPFIAAAGNELLIIGDRQSLFPYFGYADSEYWQWWRNYAQR